MSTQNVYTVYDSKSESYSPPFLARTHGEAIRSFEQAARTEKHQFNEHAEDFTLFHLGNWNDNSALYEMNLNPVPLARAHEALARQQ